MARRRKTQSTLIGTLITLAVIILVAYLESRQAPQPPGTQEPPPIGITSQAPAGSVLSSPPGPLPSMRVKPEPVDDTFKGCPPEGDGGDPVLNRLKNRVDEGTYVPVQFDAVEQLAWPKSVERKDRDNWSASDTATVAQYEGIPIAIEGYLASEKEEGPESPNCHGADHEFRDFHIWLTKTAGEDRTNSIVVETTPRLRAKHPNWTLDALRQVTQDQQRVRISGWLMLDPEHPDQVGKTRGTIWEIHPVLLMEVQQGARWVSLDELANQR